MRLPRRISLVLPSSDLKPVLDIRTDMNAEPASICDMKSETDLGVYDASVCHDSKLPIVTGISNRLPESCPAEGLNMLADIMPSIVEPYSCKTIRNDEVFRSTCRITAE